jgi:hypothetical protein
MTPPATRPTAPPATPPRAGRPVRRMRLRGTHAPRPRIDAVLVAELAARLTDRDRHILTLVHEHRVFTTHQLAAIFFSSAVKARHRLLELHRLAALERFRPWTPNGSNPWHWILGPAGAAILAATRAISVADLGYRRDTAMAISHSATLGHLIGVNQFFTELHTATRTHPGANLTWWPEHRCARLWGDLARPDAYGRWHQPDNAQGGDRQDGAQVDFFLEHDTGSEPLARLCDKLDGYAALAEATGITTPVLFHLPSTRRESNFRRLINTPTIPVATTTHTYTSTDPDGPAGPVWLPAPDNPTHLRTRLRLIDLGDKWPSTHQPLAAITGHQR